MTVSRDFPPPHFVMILTHLTPYSYAEVFAIVVSIRKNMRYHGHR